MSVLLLPLAVIVLGVWLLLEALTRINHTGDAVFAVAAIVLALAAIFVAYNPRRV